jgi:hypothetical protein
MVTAGTDVSEKTAEFDAHFAFNSCFKRRPLKYKPVTVHDSTKEVTYREALERKRYESCR